MTTESAGLMRRVGVLALPMAMTASLLGCHTTSPSPKPEREYIQRDVFYNAPAAVPGRPGMLLRAERLEKRTDPPDTHTWRILYTTSMPDGRPAIGAATVVAPDPPPPGPRPVITWEHETFGLSQACMPSLLKNPFLGVPAMNEAMDEGWVVVATDYAPDGSNGPIPYMIGEGEARSALDATRAARQMTELTLDDHTVVWGHSQGGHAALWTGIVAPGYAPDLKVVGTVPIAPATDIARILATQGPATQAPYLSSLLAVSYSHFYPDVVFNDVVTRGAGDVAVRMANECGGTEAEPEAERAGAIQLMGGVPLVPDLERSAFGQRLDENVPTARITAPVLIVQGLADNVVLPSLTDEYVNQRCAAGQSLQYWTFAESDHKTIVANERLAPEIIQWTRDRFEGTPLSGGCFRRQFP